MERCSLTDRETLQSVLGLPGRSDSLDLKSVDKDLDIDIPEGFTMEADVTDFSMSSTFTFGMTDILDSLDTGDIDGLDDLKDSIKRTYRCNKKAGRWS